MIKSIIFSIICLSLLISCWNNDSDTIKLADKRRNDSIQAVREIEELAKPAYIDAYKKVNEIKMNVKLAEKGLLKAEEVVSQFNRVLGPEMGQLRKLSQVKQRLDTAGDAYIQFKYKRAQAEIALYKAAELKHRLEMADSIHYKKD